MICNQNDIPRNVHRYGLRPSAQTGCGWIATYNALKILGRTTDIDALIRYFEWQLPLIHGNFGTSFWGARKARFSKRKRTPGRGPSNVWRMR